MGTTLNVTATINKDDFVTLRIRPEISEIGEWKNLASGEYPVINTKEAEVEVLVKSGDTVVIGGLIYEANLETVNKLPILGDIPVLGHLFRKKFAGNTDQEILVFVTPTVFGKEEKKETAAELIDFEDKVDLIDFYEVRDNGDSPHDIEEEFRRIIEEEAKRLEEEDAVSVFPQESLPGVESEIQDEKFLFEETIKPSAVPSEPLPAK